MRLAELDDVVEDRLVRLERVAETFERQEVCAGLEKAFAGNEPNGKSGVAPPPKKANGEAVPLRPKMAIEWFGEAADSALSEPANQLVEGLLDEGGLSVNYGDSGSGKPSSL